MQKDEVMKNNIHSQTLSLTNTLLNSKPYTM